MAPMNSHGNYKDQIGFRLAKQMGTLETLRYCSLAKTQADP